MNKATKEKRDTEEQWKNKTGEDIFWEKLLNYQAFIAKREYNLHTKTLKTQRYL